MFTYHMDNMDKPDYQKGLKALEYDILYGKRYVYGGKTPYTSTNLQMGYKPLKITDIVKVGSQYYIKGEGFTPFSKVSLDGEILKTSFMGDDTLRLLEEVPISRAEDLQVSQVEKNNTILSTTE